MDHGNVWEKRGDVDLLVLRYSLGAGVRYLTPADAIVLDVAWNPRRHSDESNVSAQVSIGFPF